VLTPFNVIEHSIVIESVETLDVGSSGAPAQGWAGSGQNILAKTYRPLPEPVVVKTPWIPDFLSRSFAALISPSIASSILVA
jgi:hypothetical protein